MKTIQTAIKSLIDISEMELADFLAFTKVKKIQKKAIISRAGAVCQHVFFINYGLVRTIVTDAAGEEHTKYFAFPNQFFTNYASFLTGQPAAYTLQALETTEVVVIPRTAIEWGYQHLLQGERLGRLIAESYFLYQDQHIRDSYTLSPKARYDSLAEIFPDIHNRVPQHMIASYLGISSVHLSRLKKEVYPKI